MSMANLKPAFQVKPFKGETVRNVCAFIKDKDDEKQYKAPPGHRGLYSREVKDTGGYIVYFPHGHSIRVRTDEELDRLKLDIGKAPYVDMDTGETVQMGQSLEALSNAKLARSRSGRAALAAEEDQLTAVMEGSDE